MYLPVTRSSLLAYAYAILSVSRALLLLLKELSNPNIGAGVHFGFGKHVQVARPDAVLRFYQLLYSFELLYGKTPWLHDLDVANMSSTRDRLGQALYSFLILPHLSRSSIPDVPVCSRSCCLGLVGFYTDHCHIRVHPHTLLLDPNWKRPLHSDWDILP